MTITDDRADQLAEIAAELAVRVRDDDPQANSRWLRAVLPNPGDWFQLAFVLACAVPDDRSWQQHLTAWTSTAASHRQLVDEITAERFGPRRAA